MKNKAKIFNELKLLAAILSADVSQKVLQAYVEMLSKHEVKLVLEAIKWASENCKFFPKPVELLERINPKPTRVDADNLAGRAIDAIRDFGIHRGREAQLAIGPEAWKAVSRVGGWSTLCNCPANELGTLRAQLRDQCLSVLDAPEVNRREAIRLERNETAQIERGPNELRRLGGGAIDGI